MSRLEAEVAATVRLFYENCIPELQLTNMGTERRWWRGE
jgi:hypothetical protein